MKSDKRRPTTLDLFEEAIHLLRTARTSALAWYYAGALPFVLILLCFWADMSWSADAQRDCALNAAGVALAFAWMKFCQAMCAQDLAAQIRLEPPLQINPRAMARTFLQQAIIQPSKLFVLPVALVLTIPFGWVFAFYENVTALGEATTMRTLWSKAWRQARLWPRQNHLALSIFLLLGVIVGLDLLLIVLFAPYLVKMFSGFENVFTRSGIHVFNSTVLAVVASATYLCCDPLVKAVYVLRCFYGASLHSGEDLQVELRRMRQTPVFVAAIIFALLTLVPLQATTLPAPPVSAVNVDELDRSIADTIVDPEFRWRMPREAEEETRLRSENAFDRFLKRSFRTFKKWWRGFLYWLDRLFGQSPVPERKIESDGGVWVRGVFQICLIALCAVLVAFLAMKIREFYVRSRTRPHLAPAAKAIDLTQENVTADQLPEDEWLSMARELMGRGEWRLALRAFFLAGLAHLSAREMIALARHKSNRDYQSELRRRAPAQIAVQNAFAQNLYDVERAWYGQHTVSAEILAKVQTNLEQIRTA